MTEREFLNKISNARTDVVQQFLVILKRLKARYCVVGGLAVNAYAEPVVSLDLDVVVAADLTEKVADAAKADFRVKRSPHSVNLSAARSDLRIQLQTDPRYQEFIGHGRTRMVMGYRMRVAAVEDVLRGKIWAYSDPDRRASKRQKDIADIQRLVEACPRLSAMLPSAIQGRLL